MTKPRSFQWTLISNFMLLNLNNWLKHKHTLYMILMHIQIHRKNESHIFRNNEYTNIIISEPEMTHEECSKNHKHIHTTITSQYLICRKNNKITNTTPYDIPFIRTNITTSYAYKTGTTPSQRITTLQSYFHTVNTDTYTRQCPLCLSHTHDINYLFNCKQVPKQHNTTSLCKKPLEAAQVIQKWESRLASLRD